MDKVQKTSNSRHKVYYDQQLRYTDTAARKITLLSTTIKGRVKKEWERSN
jgi:hypothetical protein